jgi:hypothetical protein
LCLPHRQASTRQPSRPPTQSRKASGSFTRRARLRPTIDAATARKTLLTSPQLVSANHDVMFRPPAARLRRAQPYRTSTGKSRSVCCSAPSPPPPRQRHILPPPQTGLDRRRGGKRRQICNPEPRPWPDRQAGMAGWRLGWPGLCTWSLNSDLTSKLGTHRVAAASAAEQPPAYEP